MSASGSRVEGSLLGCAVGDALGLPGEGMSPQRIARRWPDGWRHRFLGPWGMCSDDTEHSFFVVQSLLAQPADPDAFARSLGWRLRGWLLGLPAGIGLATLRAIVRLWLGYAPAHSGVYSAGNGPAMRSGVIGAHFRHEAERRAAFVRASTRLTHTDPKAEAAAQAVAWLAACDLEGEAAVAGLREFSAEAAWSAWIERARIDLAEGRTTAEFAAALGLERGVSGYAWHSVPVALYACLRHPRDFRAGLLSVLDCGGDTDTTGAIVGSILGARLGTAAIPAEWLAGIREWPRSISLLRRAAHRLAEGRGGPVRYFWPGLLLRNAGFLLVVLVHGFRRLAPPY